LNHAAHGPVPSIVRKSHVVVMVARSVPGWNNKAVPYLVVCIDMATRFYRAGKKVG